MNFNPRSPCGERRILSLVLPAVLYFNPRSPCGERLILGIVAMEAFLFQSTLPVWGATIGSVLVFKFLPFQSTLPVWGATRLKNTDVFVFIISIHAPRVGSDSSNVIVSCTKYISIHAPRVGSDAVHFRWYHQYLNFNPRSPCGERRHKEIGL